MEVRPVATVQTCTYLFCQNHPLHHREMHGCIVDFVWSIRLILCLVFSSSLPFTRSSGIVGGINLRSIVLLYHFSISKEDKSSKPYF